MSHKKDLHPKNSHRGIPKSDPDIFQTCHRDDLPLWCNLRKISEGWWAKLLPPRQGSSLSRIAPLAKRFPSKRFTSIFAKIKYSFRKIPDIFQRPCTTLRKDPPHLPSPKDTKRSGCRFHDVKFPPGPLHHPLPIATSRHNLDI